MTAGNPAYVPPKYMEIAAQQASLHYERSGEGELLCRVLRGLQILVCSIPSISIAPIGRVSFYTIGDPARDLGALLPSPFELGFPCVAHPFASRSRSELSNGDDNDVALKVAIFCSALRRIPLEML